MQPDWNEMIALDLEGAQMKRYRKSRDKENFWDDSEDAIFERIKELRDSSSTYHPDNER